MVFSDPLRPLLQLISNLQKVKKIDDDKTNQIAHLVNWQKLSVNQLDVITFAAFRSCSFATKIK